jgi:hypothetical protein
MRPIDPTTQRPDDPATIFDIAARLEQSYKKLMSILSKLESGDSQPSTINSQLAAMAEIRKHIAIAEKALATAVEAHAVEEFKQVVLNALAQSSVTVQKRVLTVLSQRRKS